MTGSDEARLAEPSDAEREAQDRVGMFIDFCALNKFGLDGWPPRTVAELTAHFTLVLNERDEARRERDEARKVSAARKVEMERLDQEWLLAAGRAVNAEAELEAVRWGRDEARDMLANARAEYRAEAELQNETAADRDSLSAQLDIANERLGESERQLNTAWIEGDRLSAQLAEAQAALDRADRVIEFAASKMPFFGAWADLACEALDRRKALSTPSPAHPEDGK